MKYESAHKFSNKQYQRQAKTALKHKDMVYKLGSNTRIFHFWEMQ